MSTIAVKRAKSRIRRKKHIHKVVVGTPERPRLVIFRSMRQIYAQLVDDQTRTTITGVSSLSPELRESVAKLNPSQTGQAVGEAIARKALEKNIQTVVFDRNGFPYHGRVKALAEGARKGGLQF
ncbi:MAG TPA: 50S ribosomal protein L18 [bacterium]|jgi:large subunit ribosomal protein L18